MEWAEVSRMPLDHEGENRVASVDVVTVELGEEETRRLLQGLPGAYRTRVNDVLLTGLGHALGEWAGSRVVCVELEGHGREEVFEGVDVSRTVGWFTTQGPVVLELEGDVVGSLRRAGGGVRWIGGGLLALGLRGGLREAEVSFNCLGQWDNGSLASGEAPTAGRARLVEINAAVADGRLRVE